MSFIVKPPMGRGLRLTTPEIIDLKQSGVSEKIIDYHTWGIIAIALGIIVTAIIVFAIWQVIISTTLNSITDTTK